MDEKKQGADGFHLMIIIAVLMILVLTIYACGPKETVYDYGDDDGGGEVDGGGGDDTAGDQGGDGGGKPTYADIKDTVDRVCVSCHNGSVHPLKLDSEAAFLRANVKRRIENGTMPPGGRISSADRATLLSVF